jgi:hypothetical protein
MVSIFLAAFMAAVPATQVTRWVSPDGSLPTTFREWQANRNQSRAWHLVPLTYPRVPADTRVDLLVEDSLAGPLAASLDTLVADLRRQSYEPAVYSVAGTSPESLRAFLAAEHQAGVEAAVLIGDLPVAWFQLIDDWNSNGRRDPDEGYEEFPCDLYFMDLDGSWRDEMMRLDSLDSLVPGADGIYDQHDGNMEPEMAISRLPASVIGDEVTLLRQYFDRAHRYRTGQLSVRDRALVYIDDDWLPEAWQWDGDVGMLYPDRVFVWNAETTRVLDYRPRIDTAAYQWIQLCSHSWPGGHAMKYNSGQSWDWFYATEIAGLNPEASFYNLFACSNARYVERGFCGGDYVFQTSTGLGAVGSTKTGSMLEFQDFYFPLSEGEPLGRALKDWFYWRITGGFEPWEKSWFYGMCLIGDGLLKPRVPTAIAERPARALSEPVLEPVRSPVRDRLKLNLALSRPCPVQIHLYDNAGRRVLSLPPEALPAGAHGMSLDVSGLPAGVYQLLLTFGSSRLTRPVAVVR